MLFPVFDEQLALGDVASGVREVPPAGPLYRRAPLFCHETGDFVFNHLRRPVYGTGVEGWKLWCEKSMMTQRWAHEGYSADFGIEAYEAFRETGREAVEAVLERTVTEALLADPSARTQSVSDFRFRWQPSAVLPASGGGVRNVLHLTCTVTGYDGNSVVIGRQLTIDN